MPSYERLLPLPSFLFFFPSPFGISLPGCGLLWHLTALWLRVLRLGLPRLWPLLLRPDSLP